MNKLKTNKGITLIALIITIIVMLILVGVSVNIALGNGLFKSAQNAAQGTEIAKNAEKDISSGKVNVSNQMYNSMEDYINSIGDLNPDAKVGDYVTYTHPVSATPAIAANSWKVLGKKSNGQITLFSIVENVQQSQIGNTNTGVTDFATRYKNSFASNANWLPFNSLLDYDGNPKIDGLGLVELATFGIIEQDYKMFLDSFDQGTGQWYLASFQGDLWFGTVIEPEAVVNNIIVTVTLDNNAILSNGDGTQGDPWEISM